MAEVLLNGGFETGDASNWSFNAVAIVSTFPAHGGTWYARFAAIGYLQQSPLLTSGNTYRLSLWVRQSSAGFPVTGSLSVSGVDVATWNINTVVWTQISYDFMAEVSGAHAIKVLDTSPFGPPYLSLVDDVSLDDITPEREHGGSGSGSGGRSSSSRSRGGSSGSSVGRFGGGGASSGGGYGGSAPSSPAPSNRIITIRPPSGNVVGHGPAFGSKFSWSSPFSRGR